MSNRRELEQKMNRSQDYAEWSRHARLHDLGSGMEEWKNRDFSSLYDHRDVRTRRDLLREQYKSRDVRDILFTLNEGIHGNMAGIAHPKLYARSKFGTKSVITDYIHAIETALRAVSEAPLNRISAAEKLDFFRRASHCYGRSALLLSGGGGLIYFHHGVVEALIAEDLLPNVLSGSSAGAVICAQLAMLRSNEIKEPYKNPDYPIENTIRLIDPIRNFIGLARKNDYAEMIDQLIGDSIGDTTFQEAFEHSGRCINVSVASADPYHRGRLLNAITSPNVTIRSACRASSTIPALSDPVMLEAKNRQGDLSPFLPRQRWIDGVLGDDLPMKRLSRLFGVNHFIVSQINPLSVVAPYLRSDPKSDRESLFSQSSNLFFSTLRETARFSEKVLPPIGRLAPEVFLSVFQQFANQSYFGDINISHRFSVDSGRHILFDYKDEDEIAEVEHAGRLCAWENIERIRNATKISRVIDEILGEMEQNASLAMSNDNWNSTEQNPPDSDAAGCSGSG